MELRYLSLFSGIGGLDLGFDRAGLTCVGQCEWDEYCSKVLALHWPDLPRFRDVRELTANNIPPCDMIAGGFPCQDVSQAGKRTEGIDGERSGLWQEMARLVGEVRPRLVFVENVLGLTKRGLDRVLGDLSALGYDAEWDCFGAAHVGAPHLRRRLFLIAWDAASGAVPDAFGLPLRDLGERIRQQHEKQGSSQLGLFGEDLADRDGGRHEGERIPGQKRHPVQPPRNVVDGCDLPLWPPPPDDVQGWARVPAQAQPAFCALADELPVDLAGGRRPGLKAIGNAVVPVLAEELGRSILTAWRRAHGEAS
jgi:site-specific DNA-cytosine methylase